MSDVESACLNVRHLVGISGSVVIVISCVAGFGRFGAGGAGLYSLFPGPGGGAGGGGGGASDASAAIYSQATRFAHSANTYHNFIGAHKGNYG
jgi:hypothetical protein